MDRAADQGLSTGPDVSQKNGYLFGFNSGVPGAGEESFTPKRYLLPFGFVSLLPTGWLKNNKATQKATP